VKLWHSMYVISDHIPYESVRKSSAVAYSQSIRGEGRYVFVEAYARHCNLHSAPSMNAGSMTQAADLQVSLAPPSLWIPRFNLDGRGSSKTCCKALPWSTQMISTCILLSWSPVTKSFHNPLGNQPHSIISLWYPWPP